MGCVSGLCFNLFWIVNQSYPYREWGEICLLWNQTPRCDFFWKLPRNSLTWTATLYGIWSPHATIFWQTYFPNFDFSFQDHFIIFLFVWIPLSQIWLRRFLDVWERNPSWLTKMAAIAIRKSYAIYSSCDIIIQTLRAGHICFGGTFYRSYPLFFYSYGGLSEESKTTRLKYLWLWWLTWSANRTMQYHKYHTIPLRLSKRQPFFSELLSPSSLYYTSQTTDIPGLKTFTLFIKGNCKHVECTLGDWSDWSNITLTAGQCGNENRTRGYFAKENFTIGENCDGLNTSCPAVQLETRTKCMLL